MKFFAKLLVVVIIGVFPFRLTAQRLDSLVATYNAIYPQEKVYVHTDKNYYNAGETIWMKAYLMSGLLPSLVSTNMYFEMVDENGSVLEKKVAPVLESSSISSFSLPASYNKSTVYIRAFTTWQFNFDSTALFVKAIKVISKTTADKKEDKATTTTLRFFPEGGDMVENLPSVLAFKAENDNGRPGTVKGSIVDKAGKKITDFASVHDGMGKVAFTPQADNTYKAIWKDLSGKEITTDLPAAKQHGAVLSITDGFDSKKYTVKLSADITPQTTFHIVAVSSQQVVYLATMRNTDKNEVAGEIPVTDVPSGILQVTLFTNEWKPIAERITFVDNNEFGFDPVIHKKNISLTKRAKNEIDIEVDDTTRSNLSVSITDADLYQPAMEDDNIVSRLLLTSELRGTIYKPYYYLSNPSDSVRNHRELLLLTNGWRRYNWDKIIKKDYQPVKFMPDRYLGLDGQVVGVPKSAFRGSPTVSAILQMPDSSRQMFFADIDSTGKIKMDGLFFFGSSKLFYSFGEKSNLANRAMLKIDNGLWKGSDQLAINKNDLVTTTLPASEVVKQSYLTGQGYLQSETDRNKKVQTLQEVVVKARTKSNTEKLDDQYATGLFKGGDGYTFDIENDPIANSSQSIFTYLQGRVAGLQVNPTGPSLTWRGGTPALYLDEMHTDASMLQSLSMTDVAYIKVFRPPFMAMGGGNGGIAIYTKKGGGSQAANIKGLDNTTLNGYSELKEFFSPDYATSSPNDAVPDLRTTIYWRPFILLDKQNRRANLQFYNNDVTKRFRVIIEGVNSDGKLTRMEEIIQ